MSKLSICTYNVNSIKSRDRINSFAVEIERLKSDIIYLVDTRLDNDQNRYLKNVLSNYYVHSNVVGDLAARGVSILLRKTLKIEVLDKDRDNDGNFLLLKVRYDNIIYILAVVYGPSYPSLEFYDDVYDKCFSLGSDLVLMGGDFNITIDFEKDARGYNAQRNLENTRKIIQKNNEFSLEDIYRSMHQNKLSYTWFKPNPMRRSRLDYFFATPAILNNICHSEILPITGFSDHAPLKIVYDYHKVVLESSLWVLQQYTLEHDTCRPKVYEVAKETIGTYHKTPYTDNYLLHCSQEEREAFMAKPFHELFNLELSINPNDFMNVYINNIRNTLIEVQNDINFVQNNELKQI